MQKAAIYVRVSTTEQALEGYSISAQISLLEKYAQSYNYAVYKVYQDAGISGKNIDDRPGLLQLLEDAEERSFDTVLIWKLSRLSRSLLDLLGVVNTLKENNISLLSYSEHFDTSTPIGKMLLQLLGSIAEFERNTIIENVKMGMDERFKQGLSKSSIPFGYFYEGKHAHIDKEKARAVREIFKRYASGASILEITDYLNSLGFTNRLGKPWRYEVVQKMLQNPFYIGYVTTEKKDSGYSRIEMYKGVHEPVIDKELFSEVQKKIRESRKPSRVRKTGADQLFSGLVICPYCRKGMYYVESSNIKKGKRYYSALYRCGTHTAIPDLCKGFSISSKKVDEYVIRKLECIIDSSVAHDILRIADNAKAQNILEEKARVIDTKLKEDIKIRDRYFSLFESGKLETVNFAGRLNEILHKISSLEEEKKELQEELQAEKEDLLSIAENMKSFRDFFDSLTPHEKRQLIKSLIQKVYINENKEVQKIEFIGSFVIKQ